MQEEGGIRLCLLAAPLVFSKLPCLLGTSTQTDAVLSALGNSWGLWVFTERPTRITRSLICASAYVLGIQTHAGSDDLGKHICVLILGRNTACEDGDIVTPDK